MGIVSKGLQKLGRKFRTAYAKKIRPKTSELKPMSDSWRSDNRLARKMKEEMDWETEGVLPEAQQFVSKTINAGKKHTHESIQRLNANVRRDYGVRTKAPKAKATQKRVTFKGQDMTEKNFHKSYKMAGGYKYGSIVSKEAMRTSPNVRLSGGGTGAKKALLDSYGSKGFKNYKTRSYTR
jgi:hypothetical protein